MVSVAIFYAALDHSKHHSSHAHDDWDQRLLRRPVRHSHSHGEPSSTINLGGHASDSLFRTILGAETGRTSLSNAARTAPVSVLGGFGIGGIGRDLLRHDLVLDGPDSDLSGSSHNSRTSHSEIERRRRNKLNSYIQDLSTLVPLCRNVHSRKLDKLTVLKLSVQYMKSLTVRDHCSFGPRRGQELIASDDLILLCQTISDVFMLVIDCKAGLVLYVSETSGAVLQSSDRLTGANFFELIHPADAADVRRQLTSLSSKCHVIDHQPAPPVIPCIFNCRILRSYFAQVSCETYISLAITGFIKESRTESNSPVLVALARIQPTSPGLDGLGPHGQTLSTTFNCRLSPEGAFSAIDPETTAVLGYMLHEINGSTIYSICHHADVSAVAECHHAILREQRSVTSSPYRLLCRDGSYVTVVTRWQAVSSAGNGSVDCLLTYSHLVSGKTVSPKWLGSGGFSEQLDEQSQQSSTASTGSTGSNSGHVGSNTSRNVCGLMSSKRNDHVRDGSISSSRSGNMSGGSMSSGRSTDMQMGSPDSLNQSDHHRTGSWSRRSGSGSGRRL